MILWLDSTPPVKSRPAADGRKFPNRSRSRSAVGFFLWVGVALIVFAMEEVITR